jgi:drug/metabolite transporter (DMT)-like permease
MSYLFALLAALANATSSVLQRKANRKMPQQKNLSWRLIASLLHQPVWFAGVLAVIAGFLLQAAALGTGELAAVQPVLVLELPATLVLASRVFGSRLGRREWATAVTMTAGLAGLLYFLSPSAGHTTNVRWYVWTVGVGANLAVIAVLLAWGRHGPAGEHGSRRGSSARQAAVLGAAAGVAFGLTAALMKGMTTTFSHGIAVLLTSWQLYAMIAAGGLAMFLLQSAMNAGRLIAAQPGLTLCDPVVSILWGLLGFGESVRGGVFLVLAVISGAVMAASVIALARSPLLSGAYGREEHDAGDERRPADNGPARGTVHARSSRIGTERNG